MFVFMTWSKFASKCWYDLNDLYHVDCLTHLDLLLRVLAWEWALNERCSSCHVGQTLFKGQELNQCLAWSNRDFKNQFNVVLKQKNGYHKLTFSLHVANFGAFYFENQ